MGSRKHPDKDIRALLKEAGDKNWRIVEARRYWKIMCPRECKCWKTVKCTPSSSTYLTDLRHFLDRATCWRKP
jgi:hypothetical protein